jgi:hypothetical protein
MQNTVVVRFADGTLQKGITNDFFPNKEAFHLSEKGTGEVREISFRGLKAVFFVKSFEGNLEYRERTDGERPGFGKKIEVLFRDGETLIGFTQGFAPNRTGFFVFPTDPESNNDRVFVVNAATEEVRFL